MPGIFFFDNFPGTTLDTRWIALDRVGDTSNGEKQCYRPSRATVASNTLTLTDQYDLFCTDTYPTSPQIGPYSSAMVQWRTLNFTYGTVEFYAKMPKGNGQWPALWLLGANCQATNIASADNTPPCQWPVSGSDEIDVIEGHDTDTTHGMFNMHVGSAPGTDDHLFHCNDVPLNSGVDTSTGFHDYKMVWQQGSIQWYVDGVQYCNTDVDPNNAQWVPSKPMFLIMNVAVGGWWIQPVDPTAMPQTMQIQWVKVTQP